MTLPRRTVETIVFHHRNINNPWVINVENIFWCFLKTNSFVTAELTASQVPKSCWSTCCNSNPPGFGLQQVFPCFSSVSDRFLIYKFHTYYGVLIITHNDANENNLSPKDIEKSPIMWYTVIRERESVLCTSLIDRGIFHIFGGIKWLILPI